MSLRFRVGTRGSALARAQCALAVRRLARAIPTATFEIVVVETDGDRDRRAGVALDFTSALERRLRRREIDLAVHSTKDLPARDPPDLGIAAYPRRADPRDCLVSVRGALARGSSVGSSSLRRRAQLARWRPDLSIREIRGNVDTRIRAVRSGRLDAVIVARAGLVRLRRAREATMVLPWKRFVPSPGQGAIAIEMRRRDSRFATVRRVDDPATRAAVSAERAVASALGASCNLPFGALGIVRRESLELHAEVLAVDGRVTVSSARTGPIGASVRLARRVARDLLAGGAQTLLDRYR